MSSKQPHCQITAKDFTILKVILERTPLHNRAFRCLLERKLSTARIVLRDDVDPQVATINSRVEYSVDYGPVDNRILIHGGESTVPGLTLPVTTLRGLALLGLRREASIIIARPHGPGEEMRLHRVAYQPEAAQRKEMSMQRRLPGVEAWSERTSQIVELGHYRRSPAADPTRATGGSSDEDPGPEAA
jgi:regulator of nucleoside diphosphate kinase